MASQPVIFEVPLDSKQNLIQWLNPYMPTCIALYRRLQFGHFTPGSRLFSSVDIVHHKQQVQLDEPWIIAYVDRTCRPETEVWLAASWEHDAPAGDSWHARADELVRSMLKEVNKVSVIPADANVAVNSHEAVDLPAAANGSSGVDRDQYERHLNNHKIVLFGAVHESTVAILKRLNLLDPSLVGADLPYRKYLFDLKNSTVSRNLPPGFVYGKVDPKDYALVKSRTQIPRQDRTLKKLPSCAIYPTEEATEPIAWGFLGLDASLTTLHVEPDYRGLGLAKSLSLKLFSEDMETYWQSNPIPTTERTYVEERYAHADVATDNDSSQGVCKSLGGNWYFHCFWVRIDVSQA